MAAVASSPEVGSSMNSREGLATSSKPMLTLFRWPPLQHQKHVLKTPHHRPDCTAGMLSLYGDKLAHPGTLSKQDLVHVVGLGSRVWGLT